MTWRMETEGKNPERSTCPAEDESLERVEQVWSREGGPTELPDGRGTVTSPESRLQGRSLSGRGWRVGSIREGHLVWARVE